MMILVSIKNWMHKRRLDHPFIVSGMLSIPKVLYFHHKCADIRIIEEGKKYFLTLARFLFSGHTLVFLAEQNKNFTLHSRISVT